MVYYFHDCIQLDDIKHRSLLQVYSKWNRLFADLSAETKVSHDHWSNGVAFISDQLYVLSPLNKSMQGRNRIIHFFSDKINAFKEKLSL